MRSKVCTKSVGHLASRKPDEVAKMKYCPCCGTLLEVRKCEKCKAEMDTDYIYCVKCGHGDSKRIQARMMKQMEEPKQLTFMDLADSIAQLAELRKMGVSVL